MIGKGLADAAFARYVVSFLVVTVQQTVAKMA